MVEKTTISKQEIVNQILKIGHNDLLGFVDPGIKAINVDPELFGHLIAWNAKQGEVKDSKVALPIIALRGTPDNELYENAVAHLCQLDPRNLMKAIDFHQNLNNQYPLNGNGSGKYLKTGIKKYLKIREENPIWWSRTALQHRKTMKNLYKQYHITPSPLAQAVLFDREYPKGSVFELVARLKEMTPQQAAGTIISEKIPYLIAVGALGGIKGKKDIILALIEQMSGNELLVNTKMLTKMGVFEDQILTTAYNQSLERSKGDKKVSTLKAGKAAQVIAETTGNKKLAQKLDDVQNVKLEKLGGIEGIWTVLVDKSGSMHTAIQKGKEVASIIAQQVKEKVYMIFFDTHPVLYEVGGKTLSQINDMTKRVFANGGTSIGCGLDYLKEKNIIVNGIVIVSDGGDNTIPYFHNAYKKYAATMGIDPTVYLYWVPGERDVLTGNCEAEGIPFQRVDVSGIDYYSLPNLVKTLRSSRFSLIDDIMETPLLKFKDVFKQVEEESIRE